MADVFRPGDKVQALDTDRTVVLDKRKRVFGMYYSTATGGRFPATIIKVLPDGQYLIRWDTPGEEGRTTSVVDEDEVRRFGRR